MRQAAAQAANSGNASVPKELVQRILFVIGAIVVFRLGTFIPVPGVNPAGLVALMDQNTGTLVDIFNMFSGGALGRFSLFALGVMPYISASIIIQLLATTIPTLQQIKKEGESGRRKLNQYTRYLTVILCVVQAASIATMLQAQGAINGIPVIMSTGPQFMLSAIISLTAGSMFLMWLGEQVTERGVGNGISILIYAGIVAGLPAAVGATAEMVRNGSLNPAWAIGLGLLALAVTWIVVFIERGQRRVTVNYARRAGGRQAYQGASQHLPLKLNMSGVIPAIFASALIMFPATLTSWFGQGIAENPVQRFLQTLSAYLSPGQLLYQVLFGAMIAGFCFFYTALTFNSQETADNLKKSGALIPGIRPGKQTAEYLDGVITRLTFWGAIYLVIICLMPDWINASLSVPFYFGGTSLLIIVVVSMDFMAQMQAHMVSHQYESLMKKAGRSGLIR